MILLVDNRDSFVYNLARYVRELGEDAIVRRSDLLTIDEVDRLAPSHVIVSPGPCTPREAGISVPLIRALAPVTPILGVCLGHQCIGTAFGATITRAREPRHGKTSPIVHSGAGVLHGVPSPFAATRYHSLALAGDSLPDELIVTARTEDGEIMGVMHREHDVHGVQFHPESVLTEYGYLLLENFLKIGAKRS